MPLPSRPSAPDAILRELTTLYGAGRAGGIAARVGALLDRWRSRVPPPGEGREALGLSQRDALLIAYADQVRTAGEPPLRTLHSFCRDHLAGIFSGVHLLPFYPWSSDDGFSVKDCREVDPAYGGWDDIAALGSGFDLMFDGVFNHASVEGSWFQAFLAGDPRYRGFFVEVEGEPDLSRVVRPRALPLLTEFRGAGGVTKVWTTFSADQADLNFRNPEVLLAIVEVVLFYVAKGARFLRLDAIAFLWKEIGTSCLHLPQTHAVIRLLRAVLDAVAPRVLLITETNVAHRENLSYFGDGWDEAQLVYNFALPPLVLHTLATGSAEALTRWAASLTLPSKHTTFFNFLASHDGIGVNPVRGLLSGAEIEALGARALRHGGRISYKDMPDGSRQAYELNINYLDALSAPGGAELPDVAARKFLTAHAMMLSLQGVPGVYFHSLVGSRGDPESARLAALPRRINREKLSRERLEAELRDAQSVRGLVWHGLRRLLRVRRAEPAFHPLADQRVLDVGRGVFAVCRLVPGSSHRMLCLHNCSAEFAPVDRLPPDLTPRGGWVDLLTQERFDARELEGAGVRLAGFETRWLRGVEA